MNALRLALSRWLGILLKEFIQLRRDRLTLGMIVGIPVMQTVLFGYAINSDPKHLPSVLVAAEQGILVRDMAAALQTSGYFNLIGSVQSERAGEAMLQSGQAQFLIIVPPDFERRLLRGERPALFVAADAADPAATGNAVSALSQTLAQAIARDLAPWPKLAPNAAPFELRLQRRYNPEGITQYNIVPGLLGVILTMTMVLMTAMAMTRERERGTLENLLSTPALPIEVMTGKIVPYILIGLAQVVLILTAAHFLFQVPMRGSLWLLLLCVLLFIAANLSLGMTFSALARNQLQAMQMTVFFLLPSILLSGFMFPFRGMPLWAQAIGNILPNTHFLRLVRGILLKGYGFADFTAMIWPSLWPLLLFLLAVTGLGLLSYRRTLD